ncbi:hypothetical protein PbJCM13498_39230 [Prolixibacter bellariivorans]|uniref:Uncharacterized protein n=1 Tax=Prolixibacter bellariivorans TaxID=314319 RepID=A0A5M4B4Q8_9BACT|nr:outer membrane beta-barrel protein [Prolixibacter bellariivorans]GET35060.1 hypothetical protein PbJCM13498_39230 [Prolixibacter bellariivorans]
MKRLAITSVFLLISLVSFSQSKFRAGIYVEGSHFFPEGTSIKNNGFSTGGRAYASYPIGKLLSASLGVGYRYKSNKTTRVIVDESNYSTNTYGYKTVEETYPQHYLVVPLKVKFTPAHKFFLEGGIETSWLLNYDYINDKPEFNWLLGAGYHLNQRLDASLSYIYGFKDQGMGNKNEYGQTYRNRMLTLSLSYSIFGN